MTRIENEKEIVGIMVGIYCRARHGSGKKSLCPECASLLAYARARLEHCPYGEAKTACRRCPVHCYAPGRRQAMRRVMRYAGPRMLLLHPLVYLRHLRGHHPSTASNPHK